MNDGPRGTPLRHWNWTRMLTILLVILASFAVLYIVGSIMVRFRQAILLLVLSGIAAYVLTPLVNRLEVALRFRWLAILVTYILLAAALVSLAVFLFTPFVEQSQSLVDNLRTPTAGSLQTTAQLEQDTKSLQRELRQQQAISATAGLSAEQVRRVTLRIARVQHEITDLQHGVVFGRLHATPGPTLLHGGRLPPNPQPQTSVPSSYVAYVLGPAQRLAIDYADATVDRAHVDKSLLAVAVGDAQTAYQAARRIHTIMASTPILLLRSQTWLDDHHIRIDVHDKFGQVGEQLTNQGTYLLDNAITILSETANVLLNTALILIISFYLLSDGGRLVRRGVDLTPTEYRTQAEFFVQSLDKVLGGYIRGQLFCSLLAGLLAGGGAAVLGVPYPLLIGITTFILQSIPVIGPMLSVVPAIAISLFFMPLITTLLLFAWFIIFQQVVANILGPRVMGAAVGIHPLEAMLAVLVGYPLGGLLGAFLAVPVAGIAHILIREAYLYFVLGQESTAPGDEAVEHPVSGPTPVPPATGTEGRRAAP